MMISPIDNSLYHHMQLGVEGHGVPPVMGLVSGIRYCTRGKPREMWRDLSMQGFVRACVVVVVVVVAWMWWQCNMSASAFSTVERRNYGCAAGHAA